MLSNPVVVDIIQRAQEILMKCSHRLPRSRSQREVLKRRTYVPDGFEGLKIPIIASEGRTEGHLSEFQTI